MERALVGVLLAPTLHQRFDIGRRRQLTEFPVHEEARGAAQERTEVLERAGDVYGDVYLYDDGRELLDPELYSSPARKRKEPSYLMNAMHLMTAFEGLAGGAMILLIVIAVFVAFEVIDRRTDSPGMRSHVNAWSERFFAERGTVWQAAARRATDIARRFVRRRLWEP